jgi:sigma-E processing peptidase SpoIIGA
LAYNDSGGDHMGHYVGFIMLLNMGIDFFLLLCSDFLCGHTPRMRRALLAAALGGAYAGVCLLPGIGVAAESGSRILCLVIIGALCFGFEKDSAYRCAVFMLLVLMVDGIATGFVGSHRAEVAAMAISTLVICGYRLWDIRPDRDLVQLEMAYGGRRMRITALRDTGNGLVDPVTGESVIVVNAGIAFAFTGLTKQQLQNPTEALGSIQGLRMIPYKTVGNAGGMLLALRFPEVRVGNRYTSALVAFAPEGLGEDGRFQALTGRRIGRIC